MDGRRSVSQGEGVSELSYWTTAHGVLHFPEHSKQKLLSYANAQCTYIILLAFILTYFTSLVCLFLGLLVAFWWLVFGENIFVLGKKYYTLHM